MHWAGRGRCGEQGDRVFGIVAGGGHAEFVLTHERLAVPIPSNLGFCGGSRRGSRSIPHRPRRLVNAGPSGPGRARFLVHAAGSGVGTAAVQLAHAMGCLVLGTSRTADKLERLKPLGLDHGIDVSLTRISWRSERALTASEGVNVVLDLLGGSVLAGNLQVLAAPGPVGARGLAQRCQRGSDLNQMLHKRLADRRDDPPKRDPWKKRSLPHAGSPARSSLWSGRSCGQSLIRSSNSRFFAAQMRLQSNHGFGKVVLQL